MKLETAFSPPVLLPVLLFSAQRLQLFRNYIQPPLDARHFTMITSATTNQATPTTSATNPPIASILFSLRREF